MTDEILPDYTYDFEYADTITLTEDEVIIYTDHRAVIVTQRVVEEGNGSFIIYRTDENGLPYARLEETGENRMKVTLISAFDQEDIHEYIIPDLMSLNIPLLAKDGFILHSSYIEMNGKAILFTANSGGGKSTQADLWAEHRGARVINGDKNAIARLDGVWTACGGPMSGSSPYCLNEEHPIAAVVILAKAPENHLERVDGMGFPALMHQIVSEPWNEDHMEQLMNLVSEFCDEVPVYYYACTKEEDAVDVLWQELFDEKSR